MFLCHEELLRRTRFLRVAEAALEAALEHIPAPTFVVAARGQVVAANRVGSRWLVADRANAPLLARPGGPDPQRFAVTAFASGATRQYLATLRIHTAPATLAPRWGLTGRELEVLAWIGRGATNKQIASELGCAMKTVEHHVSSILRKADVENRATLILALLGT